MDSVHDIRVAGISIHAPREGGDGSASDTCSCTPRFQSTPPARGATADMIDNTLTEDISIHAPREGGDDALMRYAKEHKIFQSTPPARGATAKMHSFTCGSLTNK